jgi:maleate isomerase
LIVPANNTVIEPELYSVGLTGVTFHSTRIRVAEDSKKGLLKMLKGVRIAARILSTCNPDAIAYCCLSSSFIRGLGWESELGKRIEQVSQVPVITAATAMLQALGQLQMEKIVTLSAYNASINKIMTRFLSENGFEVISSIGLGLPMDKVGDYPPEETCKQSQRIFKRGADGLFIGSTDLRSLSVIERLEERLQKPVVTVNQALLKYSLEAAGWKMKIERYGRLLRE